MSAATFPCTSCGAELEFKPGTTSLTCQYCSALNEIPAAAEAVEELDYQAVLAGLDKSSEHIERINSHCTSCGANVEMAANTTSQSCPFCGSNMVATGVSEKVIKPRSVLPFKVEQKKARELFRAWLASRWFAPGKLKKLATVEGDSTYKGSGGIAGLYLPHWTYDCQAVTPYTGQRGDYYYVTVPTTVMVNGKSQTRMVQQRRTRWSWVSGAVQNSFDDVLVIATTSLPAEQLHALGAWDLKELVPYRDEFLSGFRAETYTIDLPRGFVAAQGMMDPVIQAAIRADIGGDEQRVATHSTGYNRITFKHILLPIWISAYRFNGKVFRFLVNARTGAVTGERPYSAWKITGLVIAGLILMGVIGVIIAIFANK